MAQIDRKGGDCAIRKNAERQKRAQTGPFFGVFCFLQAAGFDFEMVVVTGGWRNMEELLWC